MTDDKINQIENFKCWMYGERLSLRKLDLILEFLNDQLMLNVNGKQFTKEVCERVCRQPRKLVPIK